MRPLGSNIGGGLIGDADTFVKLAAPTRRLIVIAGQSNAVGPGVPGGLTDPTLASAYSAVRYMANMGTSADPPVVDVYTVGDLEPKVYSSTLKLGIELSMGRDLDHTIPDGWAIAKFAYSSTSLVSNWDPNGTYPTAQPNLCTQLISYIAAAEVATGSTLAAIIWIQGENDAATLATANNYDDNLLEFVDAVRAGTGSSAPFIYGRLHSGASYTYVTELRTSQSNANGDRTDLIMMDQDTVALSGDNVHYDADGLVALGHLYADAVLAALGINALPFSDFTFVEAGLQVTFTDTTADRDGTLASWLWDFGDSSTSTSQNPVHTYAAPGTYNVSLTVTDNDGGSKMYTEALGIDGANWTIDATSGIGLPQDNTEWAAVITDSGETLSTPDSIYLLQDSGSPLADVNALANLTLVGSGASYQQTVAGWSALAARLTEATTGGWISTAAGLPDLATTSMLIYAVVAMPSAAAGATRNIFMAGTSSLIAARWTTASKIGPLFGAVSTPAGTAVPTSRVMPIWLKFDRTGAISKIYTDQETITPTHSTAPTGKRFALGSNGAAANVGFLYAARWDGAKAEAFTDLAVKNVSESLAWTMP